MARESSQRPSSASQPTSPGVVEDVVILSSLELQTDQDFDSPRPLEAVKDFWVWVVNCTPLVATKYRITRRDGTGVWIATDFEVATNCRGSCETGIDCPGEPAFGVDCLDPPFGVEFLLTTADGRTFLSRRFPVKPRRFGDCKTILCLDEYQPAPDLT